MTCIFCVCCRSWCPCCGCSHACTVRASSTGALSPYVHAPDGFLRVECCGYVCGERLQCWGRDIKPENIFLTSSLQFKLGDFGLAIKIDEELPFTRSGTLDYMAPEVRSGT